jgi:hypothetical protein
LTYIGADRGCQQVVNGGGGGSSVEKQCSSRRMTTVTEAVSLDNKTVTAEPVDSNKNSAAAASAKNWQGTAWLSSGPASARQREDSVDSDNVSSSVSLELHKGGKHPGICTNYTYVLLALMPQRNKIYFLYSVRHNFFYSPSLFHLKHFRHIRVFFLIL